MNDRNDEINVTEYLQETSNPSPGEMLRKKRESDRLSKTQIAQQLHLTVDTIERIEADDYEKLPAVTFVRGYIRAYAQVLKLPADEVVAEFEKLERIDQPIEFSTQKIYGERSSFNDKLPWMIAALLVGLVGIAVMWWQYHVSTTNIIKPVARPEKVSMGIKTEVVTQPNLNDQFKAIQNLILEILQPVIVRTPGIVIKTSTPPPGDDTQGQTLEDVQSDIAPPF